MYVIVPSRNNNTTTTFGILHNKHFTQYSIINVKDIKDLRFVNVVEQVAEVVWSMFLHQVMYLVIHKLAPHFMSVLRRNPLPA